MLLSASIILMLTSASAADLFAAGRLQQTFTSAGVCSPCLLSLRKAMLLLAVFSHVAKLQWDISL